MKRHAQIIALNHHRCSDASHHTYCHGINTGKPTCRLYGNSSSHSDHHHDHLIQNNQIGNGLLETNNIHRKRSYHTSLTNITRRPASSSRQSTMDEGLSTFSFNAKTFSEGLRRYFEQPSSNPIEEEQIEKISAIPSAAENLVMQLNMSDVMKYQPHPFFLTKLRSYIEDGLEKVNKQPSVGAKNADAFAFFVTGGKGTGRTRNTIEAVEMCAQEYRHQFKKIMYLYLPFLNMCPLEEEEEMFGAQELLNYDQSKKLITARMLYSYFTQVIEKPLVMPYRHFLDHCFHFIPEDISLATEIIRYDSRLNSDEELYLFMILDDCDELLRYTMQNYTLKPFSFLLRVFNDLPAIFKDRTNTIYAPIMIGTNIEGMVNEWVHKLGPTRSTYAGSSYQKNETFTTSQFPLLSKEQVEQIMDNMFEKKGHIVIEDENGNGHFIDKANWRKYFLLFIASVHYLHKDFCNFQYAIERTKYELKANQYNFTELARKNTDNQIEKIIVSTISGREILEVTGMKTYEFSHFSTYFNSGIVFPMIKKEDETIFFNNFHNLERAVRVPFIFLDELIEQIPEETKNKQVFRSLCVSLKELFDLNLLDKNGKIETVEKQKREAWKVLAKAIESLKISEIDSPYIRDLLSWQTER
ncbi:hypothetical protein C9374_008831 [Naegleria lovaniensis]|uniref:Uncharacterized protein n=1 Tax=Naegleria lovaniensis TaxID=51637 RepID=A0AA88GIC7_NAELO|nr:uncharacterized protein C9374_008831 [Naegleria lovaniensis]KAG2377746.1 hypothetical protein C9374_008831 [Naegleria lovaniensis]